MTNSCSDCNAGALALCGDTGPEGGSTAVFRHALCPIWRRRAGTFDATTAPRRESALPETTLALLAARLDCRVSSLCANEATYLEQITPRVRKVNQTRMMLYLRSRKVLLADMVIENAIDPCLRAILTRRNARIASSLGRPASNTRRQGTEKFIQLDRIRCHGSNLFNVGGVCGRLSPPRRVEDSGASRKRILCPSSL